ncbi:adhesin [Cupriavidus basilensis]|uniref:adhesin n=1 Tax=Cupriavidus basilensis TaxID=68895 RepID=UPI0009E30540|nr:adhesin [Cupriavidus basilensis]
MLLTDMSFTLIVSSIALATTISTSNKAIDEALSIGTGQYMANVASAANTYTFDNFTALAASPAGSTTMTVGSVSAVVANPLHPTIQDFINLKLLPIGYSEKSPLGLTFAIDLTPTNCAGDITGCTIPGRLYSTTAYRDTAGNIRTDHMTLAVETAGVDGGTSYAESPTVVTGMAASWTAPNPLPGSPAGVLMMRVGNSSLLAQSMNQFYKRDGSLNLTGPMDANNQAMNRVGNFQSNGSVSANGNVAAAGQVSGGTLRSAGDASIAGNASANGLYGNRIQSYGDASVGGLMSANAVTTNQVTSYGNISATGSVAANGYLYAAGSIVPSTGGGQTVTEGQWCGDPQGSIRSDPAGRVLSCQSSVWRLGSGTSSVADGVVVGGATVCSNYCYVGICVTKAGAPGQQSPVGGWACAPGTEFIPTSTGYLSNPGGNGG